uniref:RRM domain-containing protein n=1 Tax=Kalanchoe fedtschenkoi TaxID=63787 RepID=A0A7N0SXD0_KALFE
MDHLKGSYSIRLEGSSKLQEVSVPKTAGQGVWGQPLATDVSLFTSSLPVFSHEKLEFSQLDPCHQSSDAGLPIKKAVNSNCVVDDTSEDSDRRPVGFTLPDDEEELLAGAMEDFDLSGLPSRLEDLEDDIFGSGGGLELDADPQEGMYVAFPKAVVPEGFIGNGVNAYNVQTGVGTVAGEHPYGEHPSRTLFVRNINSNVEDSELRAMFEQYGDIRTLYTACKHRGFVMISYYDIRDARTAMRLLQNKPLRRRKLDIHFSIPKDNPSEKDINQGTLVVFNLDASVSNDDLRLIFGTYGEVKEIRETPHKRHHKFVEYYDVRAAEAALKALNRCDIAGKRIKLEPSRPGGIRRNFMQHPSQELDQDDALFFRHLPGSPLTSSPPGYWPHLNSSVDSNSLRTFSHSPGTGSFSPLKRTILPGLGSILPSQASNSPKIGLIGKEPGFTNFNLAKSPGYQQSTSYPELNLKANPGPISPLRESNSKSFDIGTTLSGPQYLWGSPTLYSERTSSTSWSTSSTDHPVSVNLQAHVFPYSNGHRPILGPQNHHHVGSAPSGVPFTRQLGYFPESPDISFMKPVTFKGLGFSRNNGDFMMNMGTHGSMTETGSPSSVMSFRRDVPMFDGNRHGIGNFEGFAEHGWIQRTENNVSQLESKKQYQLDLEKIISGEDTRTTLMIKNIPNKYTSKMLLAAIDENHRGTYDFLYLPIDFKNKCNVGYAFINMISPSNIVSFYQAFNGKRWEKFNSEKVASLAYGRIQGKAALILHFQNSSLMNEDKRCRPILFHSEGHESSDQEPLPSGNLNICIRQPDGSYAGDSLDDSDDNFD